MLTKFIIFVRSNMVLAIVLAIVALLAFFPRQLKRMFRLSPVRRRRRRVSSKYAGDRVRGVKRVKRSPIRSVGGKGYAAAGGGYIPFKYNKNGTVKKAWQVGGTVAAKSRMARLRRAK